VTLLPASRHRQLDRQSLLAGGIVAAVINLGGLGGLYYFSRHSSHADKPHNEVFVDVKLLRFGKKRDTSFLPHVDAAPRVTDPDKIKVTDNPDRPKDRPKEQPKRDLSKLFDTVKNLRPDDDDRANKATTEEGDPNGVHGGTAAEAVGDPYILAIVAAIVERWTVPTMLTPGELAKLEASACLKIDDSGKLVEFRVERSSGNSLFDGSLLATLGTIRELPKPHGPFARFARSGRLCPTFAKQ
jgi:hypothetical protein